MIRVKIKMDDSEKIAQEIIDGSRPPETDSLDVIDALIASGAPVEFVHSSDGKVISRSMAERLRFDLGVDIRISGQRGSEDERARKIQSKVKL